MLRRTMLVLSMVAMLVFSAVPAMAQDRDDRRDDRSDRSEDDSFFFFGGGGFDDDDFDNDFFGFDGDDSGFDFNGDGFEFDQDTESGDIEQDFEVSGTGDNANQCVGISGATNTGNAQNLTGVVQFGSSDENRSDRSNRFLDGFGSGDDDFDFEDTGSDVEVDGSSDVSCTQEVNQAAAASS